jgi:hypothetical protein
VGSAASAWTTGLIASIELYLDVINLFLFLLQLLTGAARSNN